MILAHTPNASQIPFTSCLKNCDVETMADTMGGTGHTGEPCANYSNARSGQASIGWRWSGSENEFQHPLEKRI